MARGSSAFRTRAWRCRGLRLGSHSTGPGPGHGSPDLAEHSSPGQGCIDVRVRMKPIDDGRDVPLLAAIGFRCRPEPWNRFEVPAGQRCRKFVFAPPVGARSCNVSLRENTGPNARYALLFRDYLRVDEAARRAWGAFKERLALSVPDLLDYGQIKAPATDVLMAAAERWAADTGWTST